MEEDRRNQKNQSIVTLNLLQSNYSK